MFGWETSGSTEKTERWLRDMSEMDIFNSLSRFGQIGADALASATPVRSNVTASSWTYEIVQKKDSWAIIWGNTNVVDGTPVAILIQHGHGTGTGGYVEGFDYINPALRPIFDNIVAEFERMVKSK